MKRIKDLLEKIGHQAMAINRQKEQKEMVRVGIDICKKTIIECLIKKTESGAGAELSKDELNMIFKEIYATLNRHL